MEREKQSLEESIGSTLTRAANDTAASAESISEQAGEAVGSAAENLRRELPENGMVGEGAAAISSGVRRTADYLQAEGMSGMVEDLEVLIRRYPLQTLLVGLGCGYLLSRLRPD